MKYLIADDNENIRRVIRQALGLEGASVIECSNGDDALTAYARFKPDYVLMDIQMSGKDGFRTTEEIRRRFPDARVVIVTDFDTPAFRRAALNAGAFAFIPKEEIFKLRDMLHNLKDELQ
ncbi:MAG TPA: response regulator transcription factor [Bacteroidota bacterium]|nr:response regulator transcription factor [Bacteroidota bacterium]